jgi:glycosyltransferase involved in cell wall biosynthesis
MNKIKISVVIITYNEEKNIERCLNSVQNVADEIVVVDSFSTDKTENICKKYNVIFIKHKFEGHIQQKNFALTQSTNDYILSLDADEELSDELKKSILEIKNNWTCDGYTFNRMTNYCGKWIHHTCWYPDRKLRLFDKKKGEWGGTNPHDKFILNKGCSKSFLKGDLLHYNYYEIREHILKINKYSDISSKNLIKKGKKTNIPFIIIRIILRFIRDYFIKLGFLDGWRGFVICVNAAFGNYLKYIKLYEFQKRTKMK